MPSRLENYDQVSRVRRARRGKSSHENRSSSSRSTRQQQTPLRPAPVKKWYASERLISGRPKSFTSFTAIFKSRRQVRIDQLHPARGLEDRPPSRKGALNRLRGLPFPPGAARVVVSLPPAAVAATACTSPASRLLTTRPPHTCCGRRHPAPHSLDGMFFAPIDSLPHTPRMTRRARAKHGTISPYRATICPAPHAPPVLALTPTTQSTSTQIFTTATRPFANRTLPIPVSSHLAFAV